MHRAADDNNLMRSVLFESDGYFICFIFLNSDKGNRGIRLDFIVFFALNYAILLFSYSFHLARNTGHGKTIVNDCQKKKLYCVLFLKHMQSMGFSAKNY